MAESLASALDRAVALFAEREAMVDGAIRWTYDELGSRVQAFDAALDGFGLGDGDVVAVLAKNSRAHLVGWLGVPRSGRVLNELNTRLSPAEFRFILEDSAARILIVDDEFLPTARNLLAQCPALERLVYAGDGDCPSDCGSFEAMTTPSQSSLPRPRPAAGAAVAGIFYTGGTTGRPKGVQLTHANLMANAKHALICFGYTEHDTYLHAGPMFHLADGASTVALTWVGGRHVIVPGFDPHRWLSAVATEGVTRAMLVPTMINMLLAQPIPDEIDVSSLRSVLYGASPMPQALLRKAMATLSCDWCQVYGMTETAPIVSFLSFDDHRKAVSGDDPDAAVRLRSAGRPVVGVQVEIRTDQDQPAPTSSVGEIVVRGPNVMAGYLNRPEETAAALTDDGWYRTGDAGYLDAHGYLFVVDRLKDMIISGGENVYSTEVENALYRHPGVREVAVFGLPDDRWGEAVHAAVVLTHPDAATSEALRAYARELLAGYKVPQRVHIIDDELPKSGAGKVLKRTLRQRLALADA